MPTLHPIGVGVPGHWTVNALLYSEPAVAENAMARDPRRGVWVRLQASLDDPGDVIFGFEDVEAHVDTGSSRSVLSWKRARSLGLDVDREAALETVYLANGEEQYVHEARLVVRLQDEILELPIWVAPEPKDGDVPWPEGDMILGMAGLLADNLLCISRHGLYLFPGLAVRPSSTGPCAGGASAGGRSDSASGAGPVWDV
jgi:hypothetical protein